MIALNVPYRRTFGAIALGEAGTASVPVVSVFLMMKVTSPIAFVYDDSIGTNSRSDVKELAEGINRIDLKISEYRRIRGVEFQELFMFLSKDYWDKLSGGAAGLNSADWERLTCLYTIASRPKDGLVIFLID